MNTTVLARIEFTDKDLDVIKRQFFPAGGSVNELNYCLAVAKELGLSPITKEIFFVPRRQQVDNQWVTKVEPMVGRDGFLTVAHRTTQLAGMKTTSTIKETPRLVNGAWEYAKDLSASCEVWRKDSDRSYICEVSYSEYVQTGNGGAPTKFWAKMPDTMLKKVAESQALRKAFNICGVYCPEETGAGYITESGDFLSSNQPAQIINQEKVIQIDVIDTTSGGGETPVAEQSYEQLFGAEQSEPAEPSTKATEKIYLKVSFTEKDTVKALGARFDGTVKKWYVPVGVDAAGFGTWIDSSSFEHVTTKDVKTAVKPDLANQVPARPGEEVEYEYIEA